MYDAAAEGVDSVWLARGDDAEELLVVRAGAAAIAYDLELPEGSTLIAPPGFPGLVEVRDARGEAWLRMSADAAWDARGHAVAIAVRVSGSRVSIDVPTTPSGRSWSIPRGRARAAWPSGAPGTPRRCSDRARCRSREVASTTTRRA